MHIVTLRFTVGAILALIGIGAFVIALGYDFGSSRRMGPGYFPIILSVILTLLALSEIASALMNPEAQALDWRPMIAILTGVAGFAGTMYFLGLIPAFFVVIGVSALSERGYGWVPALVLASATSIGAWLLFSRLLGMTLPLFHLGP